MKDYFRSKYQSEEESENFEAKSKKQVGPKFHPLAE